jgi:glycine/D-amino acid oxidase-like deaminating enzyme
VATPVFRHDPYGYWLDEAGRGTATRPLEADAQADVVIIGGGYAGLWTAWAIRQEAPDARVVLLEARCCGEGPSGRNAGFLNSLWHRLDALAARFGDRASLAVCTQAAKSVDEIGEWAAREGIDIWFRKSGHLKVATSEAQDARRTAPLSACARLGAEAEFVPLSSDEVRSRCSSPRLRGGALVPDSATVQPARLVLGLREALLRRGVAIHERSRARRLTARAATGVVVETEAGARVFAPNAVVTIGASAAGFRPLRDHLAVTSTHMVITEPVPDILEEVGWTGGESISTLGTYLHYLRTTPDRRIAFGWAGGRLAYGSRLGRRVEMDPTAVDSVRAELTSFFPGLRSRRVERGWGGPVDVSPARLPVAGTLADGRTHHVYGFTGNGVGPSHLAGKILAGLALDRRNELTGLALVEPAPAHVPPEPVRYLGGMLVRAALLRKEERDSAGLATDAVTELILDIPRRFGLHLGR